MLYTALALSVVQERKMNSLLRDESMEPASDRSDDFDRLAIALTSLREGTLPVKIHRS